MADDFEEIQCVGPALADELKNAGYESYQGIAVSTSESLSQTISVGVETAEQIIDGARERADIGGFESGSEVLDRQPERRELAFGIDKIDELLGGGLRTGESAMLYGSANSGRRIVAHHLAVRCQLPRDMGGLGGSVVYIDTRGSFRLDIIEEVVEEMSEAERNALEEVHDVNDGISELAKAVLDGVHLAVAHSSDHQTILEQKIRDLDPESEDGGRPIRLVIVDSVAEKVHNEIDSDQYTERSQELHSHFREIDRAVGEKNAVGLVINRRGSDSGPFGGQLTRHWSTCIMKLKKQSDTARELELVDAPGLAHGSAKLRIDGASVIPR